MNDKFKAGGIVLAGIIGASSLVLSTDADQKRDKDCSDFNSQKEAQAFFTAESSLKGNDFHGLDRDGDGIVCETLP